MKKFASALFFALSFCLLFALSAAAGEPIDLTGAAANVSGEGWSWNHSAKVLSLMSLDLVADEGDAIRLPANSRVHFIGESRVSASSGSAVFSEGYLSFTGSGQLELSGSVYGVHSPDVTLMANGIQITGGTAAASGFLEADAGFEMTVSDSDDFVSELYRNQKKVRTGVLYPVYVTVGRGGGASFYNGMFAPGQTVTISARPRYGYGLKYWLSPSAGIEQTDETTITFTMPEQPVRVIGVFQRVYHVTVPADLEGGHVEFYTEGPYTPGQQVILYAVPDTGYYFSHWTSDYGRFRDPLQSYAALNMPSIDAVCTPVFVKGEAYRLKVEILGEGSTNIDFGNFPQNKSVLLRATPAEGYVFSGWMSESGHFLSSTARQTYYTMPGENATVTAVFSLKDEYKKTLTVEPLVGGTVNVTGGLYSPGLPITLTAEAKTGYRFAGWSIEPKQYEAAFSSTAQAQAEFLMPPEDVTISARFELLDPDAVTFYLSVANPEGGTITCEGAGDYLAGYEFDLSASPAEGYYFAGWKSAVGGKFENSLDPNTIFYMPANDTQITAVFSPIIHVGEEGEPPAGTSPTDGADLEPDIAQEYLSFGTSLLLCGTLAAGGTWYAGVSRRAAGLPPLKRRGKKRRFNRKNLRPKREL